MIGDQADEAARLLSLEDRQPLESVASYDRGVRRARQRQLRLYARGRALIWTSSWASRRSIPGIRTQKSWQQQRPRSIVSSIHSTSAVRYGPIIELAAKLAEITPPGLDVAFFGNSGRRGQSRGP